MELFICSIHFSSLSLSKLLMKLSKSSSSTYSGNRVFPFCDRVLLGDGIVGALHVFSFDADFETVVVEKVIFETLFLFFIFQVSKKQVGVVRVLVVSYNGDVGGSSRFCSVDNSLSKVCCDDDSSLGVCCVDDDVFGSDTGNISCSFSSSSTFFLNCGCNVSGLPLTV